MDAWMSGGMDEGRKNLVIHDAVAEPGVAPASPEVDVAVEEVDETEERLDVPWRVILFNDDIHTFDEVILQLIKAIGCPTHRALRLAMEAHFKGKTKVYEGAFEDCFRVQGVLREIQLVTEIEG